MKDTQHNGLIIKICGITNEEDALAAVEAGATAIGFNFYPLSPRYITPAVASEIASKLPSHILKAGVFVNEDAPVLKHVGESVMLDILQIHGKEPDAPTGNFKLWKSVPVDEYFHARTLAAYHADAFLLDTPTKDFGGSGKIFNWSQAANLPYQVIIAGGLDKYNVGKAIEIVRPWGVDACSRIERAPRLKDHRKMAEFIAAAFKAGNNLAKTANHV